MLVAQMEQKALLSKRISHLPTILCRSKERVWKGEGREEIWRERGGKRTRERKTQKERETHIHKDESEVGRGSLGGIPVFLRMQDLVAVLFSAWFWNHV